MFTYTFDSKKPLYIQLYDFIKADIIEGRLKTDEKLPSKRSAAKNLGISVITVENAYSDLQCEGYIYSLPKKGFFVSEIQTIYPTSSKVEACVSSDEKRAEYKFDFSSNGIVSDNFPFSIWAKLMRATFNRSQRSLMLPSPSGGVPELREAICLHLKQFRNMDISPEQVIIGAGTEYLYSLIVQLLGKDKTFAVQNPGYSKISAIYNSIGVKCAFIGEDKQGIKIEELLKSGAEIAHISPSHHFPSGTVMSAARRHELLKLANENENRFIIEDDYDSEFRLSGRPLPSLQSLDKSGKVIYVNTFTKSLAPTIRISYMVLPKALASKFYKELGFYSCTVSTFEQYTLASFISEGFFEKHINRMRNYYKKTRDSLLKEIQCSSLSEICTVAEEEAGLHFLLKLKTELSDEQIKKKAKEQSLNLSFLSEYYLCEKETAPEHTLVMNYSAIKPEDIKPAVELLEKVMA